MTLIVSSSSHCTAVVIFFTSFRCILFWLYSLGKLLLHAAGSNGGKQHGNVSRVLGPAVIVKRKDKQMGKTKFGYQRRT